MEGNRISSRQQGLSFALLYQIQDCRLECLRRLRSENKFQILQAKKSALLRLKNITSLRLNLFQQNKVY